MSGDGRTDGLRLKLAGEMGFCFGVRRAVELVERLAAEDGVVTILGSLVHNPRVIDDMERMGVRKADSLDEVHEGTLVIPSHGAAPAVFDEARRQGLSVVDATCPFVRLAQQAGEELRAAGFQVVVVGEASHTEVRGIVGWAGGKARVVAGPDDLAKVRLAGKVGILAQTTQTLANLQAVIEQVTRQSLGKIKELRVINTICGATVARQTAVAALAKEVEVLVVVGGRDSANTRRLVEIGRQAGAKVHQVEEAAALRETWFAGRHEVGVTAGASTPDAAVQEVVARILALGSN